jgi:N-acetylglutamate synthase-like GNAT family acetyltransferase
MGRLRAVRMMIRQCTDNDFDTLYAIVNDSAGVYKGVIPADCWNEPYMSQEYLRHELDAGVLFWGYETDGHIAGIMGIQDVQDVTLIRHAYVNTAYRGQGIGSKLIAHLKALSIRPTLVGTWAAAVWAIRFYEKHGFRLVTIEEKKRLLRKYWSVPERQTDSSVVLADSRWFKSKSGSFS